MNVEKIEIHTGKADFACRSIRRLEARVEASSNFSSAPSIADANAKLRELAAKVGANAIVEVEYNSGISMTSWRSMKATGLAVLRDSDEISCPFCAENIKRAAKICRFCGNNLPEPERVAIIEKVVAETVSQEPLKGTNNSLTPYWIATGVVIVFFFLAILSAASR